MKTKHLKKILLLIAIIILLVGLASAATTNKTSTTKDTKILKETKKPIKTGTNNKIISKNKDNKKTIHNKEINIPKKTINTSTNKNNQSIKSNYYYYVTVKTVSKTVYGRTTYLEAKLKNFDKNIDGGDVYFYVDNKYVGSKTAKKTVKLKYTFNDIGTYEYTAIHVDNDGYENYDTGTIKVKPRYTISITSPTTAKPNQKIKVTVKLLEKQSKIQTGSVRLKLNGKVLTNKKVKNGIVTINYKMPKTTGTYTIKAEYIKNNKIIKASSKKIKVKNPIVYYSSYAKSKKPYTENPHFQGERMVCSTIKINGHYYHLGCGGLLLDNGYTESFIDGSKLTKSLRCYRCGHVFCDYKYDYTAFL